MFDTDALRPLPHRPDTGGVSGPPSYSLVAIGALLATVVLTGPDHGLGSAEPASGARSAVPLSMSCRLEPNADGEASMRIGNTARAALPAGTRIAWAGIGTPNPSGGVLVLPQPLAPGEALTLFPAQPAQHSAGCEARALADGAAEALHDPH